MGIGITLLIIFLFFVIMLLFYGIAIEPHRFEVRRERAEIPHLPPAWEGKHIAVIGDFQLGMWLDNASTIRRIVHWLLREKPDIVLVLGDYIYHSARHPEKVMQDAVQLMSPLIEAGIPTYSVLGNHDFAMSAREDPVQEDVAQTVRDGLHRLGITILHNSSILLDPASNQSVDQDTLDEGLYLIGLGADYPQKDRPEVALDGVPPSAPRIFIMHNPQSFKALPANSAPLAVAGHTHGGQICLPFLPNWSYLTPVLDLPDADGWIEGYGKPGNHLFINRGVGFSAIPIRINCPPEVTWFTLHKI